MDGSQDATSYRFAALERTIASIEKNCDRLWEQSASAKDLARIEVSLAAKAADRELLEIKQQVTREIDELNRKLEKANAAWAGAVDGLRGSMARWASSVTVIIVATAIAIIVFGSHP